MSNPLLYLVQCFAYSLDKNDCLAKISILLQFGGEILALSCSGDSIQILLILRTKAYLEGFDFGALREYINVMYVVD